MKKLIGMILCLFVGCKHKYTIEDAFNDEIKARKFDKYMHDQIRNLRKNGEI